MRFGTAITRTTSTLTAATTSFGATIAGATTSATGVEVMGEQHPAVVSVGARLRRPSHQG